MAESPWIIDVTEETFQTVVIDQSQAIPVIVDFWATWCQPCRHLGPLLEKLANEAAGAWILAKVNVDEQQQIAAAFQVQSIPTVFAVQGGQILDQFAGLLPEPQLREWLGRFQPSAEDLALTEAKALATTDPRAAEEKFLEVLESTNNKDAVKIELARFYVDQHRDADSRALLDQLEARGFLEPQAQDIKAELELRAAAAESGGVGECRTALASDPENPTLKLHLADALAAVKQFPEALDLCLELVKTGDAAIKEQAKTTMVNMFLILGNGADLTQSYRRKLATALY